MKRIFKIGTLLLAFLLACGWCVAQGEGFHCGNNESKQTRPVAKTHLGDVTKKAIQLPRPKHSQLAKAGAYGNVKAQVTIDINTGHVVWAKTTSGHPLLQAAVRDVVCKARFAPVLDANGFVSGTLNYQFARRRGRSAPNWVMTAGCAFRPSEVRHETLNGSAANARPSCRMFARRLNSYLVR